MLIHPTLDQMRALGLAGMAAAYCDLVQQPTASDFNRDEWLGLMLDREVAVRADKRLSHRLAAAKLRFADACIENIDFAIFNQRATVGTGRRLQVAGVGLIRAWRARSIHGR